MGLLSEYTNKHLDAKQLENELRILIQKYNQLRDTYLLVYASAINKSYVPDIAISQDDYFIIHDLLKNTRDVTKVDIYLETPGGSGEATEEIVEFLRSHFSHVSFIVSGEAKSAGTIMVLSGDEILMTETGSLGPIDAQMKIGRSIMSAYDYIEWVTEKQQEASDKGALNPFDAVMVAQISPGELKLVFHNLKFAEDLVVKWLKKYKFKNWNRTKTRGIEVTDKMKEERAKEIVRELINHAKWRSHGRSIKINDLEDLKLEITKIDENPNLKDLVYRIQTICRLLFNTTSIYKIFATSDGKIFRHAITQNNNSMKIPTSPNFTDAVKINIKCNNCGKIYSLYVKLAQNHKLEEDLKREGLLPFPSNNKLKCNCGFEIDLSGLRNEIEITTGKKVIN